MGGLVVKPCPDRYQGTSVTCLALKRFNQIQTRNSIKMPAQTTTVAAGMAVTAVAAGVNVASFLQDWARRREKAAALRKFLEHEHR